MIQLTDKLFSVPVSMDANYTTSFKRIEYISITEGINAIAIPFEFKIVGTVSKDTIDFDVVDVLPLNYYLGLEKTTLTVDQYAYVTFRSLLTSKGCNPDEKHLIIEKI